MSLQSVGNTLQSAVPLERNPIGTKAQQNENMCPIRSKEAFVLTGFRSDGPTPLCRPRANAIGDNSRPFPLTAVGDFCRRSLLIWKFPWHKQM